MSLIIRRNFTELLFVFRSLNVESLNDNDIFLHIIWYTEINVCFICVQIVLEKIKCAFA